MYIERIRHPNSHYYSRDEVERTDNKRKNILSSDAVALEPEGSKKEERQLRDQADPHGEGENHPPNQPGEKTTEPQVRHLDIHV